MKAVFPVAYPESNNGHMSQTSVEKVTPQQDSLVSRPTIHYTENRVVF
jgi:hypothetical protein